MSWQDQVEAVNPPQYEDGTDYPPRVCWFAVCANEGYYVHGWWGE